MVRECKFTKKHKPLLERLMLFSDPDWIRTNDPQLRRLVLYPAELPGRCSWCIKKVRKGMENKVKTTWDHHHPALHRPAVSLRL